MTFDKYKEIVGAGDDLDDVTAQLERWERIAVLIQAANDGAFRDWIPRRDFRMYGTPANLRVYEHYLKPILDRKLTYDEIEKEICRRELSPNSPEAATFAEGVRWREELLCQRN